MASVDNNHTVGGAADALDRLSACNILVAGDVMLDRYWFGRVERISPEAPVPVVAVERSDERIGGAGNVACNITALGGRCTLLGVVGDDEAGRNVEIIAKRAGVERQLITDPAAQTTIKLRVISRNQQLLRADFESSPTAAALDETAARYDELLAAHQAVVLSDYGKGGLGKCAQLIQSAAAKNIPVLVDPKGGDFSRYHGAHMVTPNLQELEQAAGAVADDKTMQNKAGELIAQHDLAKVLVTLSERGMALFSGGGAADVIRRPARAREVFDVSGAGDSVIAVMAMATAAGLDDATALVLANSVAGVVVSKLGAATAGIDEVKAALRRDYPE